MAKSKRHGGKKSRKGKKARKNAKKLVRFNALRREGYSKAEAHALAFGGKKGRKSGGKKGRKAKSHRRHGGGGVRRATTFPKILAEVQRNEGTTGWPPTAAEREMAEQILFSMYAKPSHLSEEEKLKRRFQAEKAALIKRRAAAKLREAEREYREELKRKAEREAEAELRNL